MNVDILASVVAKSHSIIKEKPNSHFNRVLKAAKAKSVGDKKIPPLLYDLYDLPQDSHSSMWIEAFRAIGADEVIGQGALYRLERMLEEKNRTTRKRQADSYVSDYKEFKKLISQLDSGLRAINYDTQEIPKEGFLFKFEGGPKVTSLSSIEEHVKGVSRVFALASRVVGEDYDPEIVSTSKGSWDVMLVAGPFFYAVNVAVNWALDARIKWWKGEKKKQESKKLKKEAIAIKDESLSKMKDDKIDLAERQIETEASMQELELEECKKRCVNELLQIAGVENIDSVDPEVKNASSSLFQKLFELVGENVKILPTGTVNERIEGTQESLNPKVMTEK